MGMVGGDRHYQGAPLAASAPWECPRCAQENTGAIDAGCVHCGSGSARPSKAPAVQQVATPPPAEIEPQVVEEKLSRGGVASASLEDVARAWLDEQGRRNIDPVTAFVAGYRFALQHTMKAPPVTVDVAQLAPEGKTRRTIIAALDLFKDQVLREATEEIASGEWCSIEEVEQLVRQLKTEEGSL